MLVYHTCSVLTMLAMLISAYIGMLYPIIITMLRIIITWLCLRHSKDHTCYDDYILLTSNAMLYSTYPSSRHPCRTPVRHAQTGRPAMSCILQYIQCMMGLIQAMLYCIVSKMIYDAARSITGITAVSLSAMHGLGTLCVVMYSKDGTVYAMMQASQLLMIMACMVTGSLSLLYDSMIGYSIGVCTGSYCTQCCTAAYLQCMTKDYLASYRAVTRAVIEDYVLLAMYCMHL